MPADLSTPCRRCTECEGEEHHWLEDVSGGDADDSGEPLVCVFACKHCDHECLSVECDGCLEFVPVDICRTNADGAHVCFGCLVETGEYEPRDTRTLPLFPGAA